MNTSLKLFAPGPVAVHERVRAVLGAPVFHHRAPEFRAILAKARQQLQRLWQTPDWEPLMFTSSGSGAMEGAVVNFMRHGAKAITVSAGKFGERWARILSTYGCEPLELRLEWGRVCDVDQVLDLVDKHPDVRAVFMTSADTSTGVEHPIEILGPAIRKKTDALIVVDCICDLGGADVAPERWQADLAVGTSQKCLGLPPGLGLAIISPRAWEFSKTADLPRSYFDWRLELERHQENLTAYTSSVSLICGLAESLTMIEEEGLAAVVDRHRRFGGAVRAAIGALDLECLPDTPTNCLTVVKCPEGLDGTRVVSHMADRYSYRIANGQDRLKGQIFRLGHMGVLTEADVLGLLDGVELTLRDLGVLTSRTGVATEAAQQHMTASRQKVVPEASGKVA
jgi:aspartate aminotransferase-like enzyme